MLQRDRQKDGQRDGQRNKEECWPGAKPLEHGQAASVRQPFPDPLNHLTWEPALTV